MSPEELAAAEKRLAEIEAQLAGFGSKLPGYEIRNPSFTQRELTSFLPQEMADSARGMLPYRPTVENAIDLASVAGSVAAPQLGLVGLLSQAAIPLATEAVKQGANYAVSGRQPGMPSNPGGLALEMGLGALGPTAGFLQDALGPIGQGVNAAQEAYRANPVVQQSLKAAEGIGRSEKSPFGLLTKSADSVDLLSKQGQAAVSSVTARSDPSQVGYQMGVAPRVNKTDIGFAEDIGDQGKEILDTKLFENGGEIDPFSRSADGAVATFKPGMAPPSLQNAAERIATARDAVMGARASAVSALDQAIVALPNPNSYLVPLEQLNLSEPVSGLRQRLSVLASSGNEAAVKLANSLDSALSGLEKDVTRMGAGGGMPSQINDLVQSLNAQREAIGAFARNPNSILGDPTLIGAVDELNRGYQSTSVALRDALETQSESIINAAKASGGDIAAKVSEYDPGFIKRMNKTYEALIPAELGLTRRAAEVSQAMGSQPLAGGIPAMGKAVGEIPMSKTGMALKAVGSGVNALARRSSPSLAAGREALLRQQAQDPLEMLKAMSMMQSSGMPKLPRSVKEVRRSMPHARLASTLLYTYRLIGSPEEFYSSPEAVQEQMLGSLAERDSNLFAQPHGGYKSLFNNRLRSPADQALHLQNAFQNGSLKDKAEVFDSLNQGGLYRAIEGQGEALMAPPMVTPTPMANDPYGALMGPMDMQEGANGVWGVEEEQTDAETSLQRMERLSGAYNSGY